MVDLFRHSRDECCHSREGGNLEKKSMDSRLRGNDVRCENDVRGGNDVRCENDLRCCNIVLYFIATGFGSGLIPKAPGTFGSLVGLLLAFFLAKLNIYIYIILTLLFFIAGIFITSFVQKNYFNTEDPGPIVWDEIVGILVTFIFVPMNIYNLILGFVLFRIFDIFKPWPINWADQRLSSGLGIMLDDIIAGVYANIAIQLIILWLIR